MGLDLMGRAGLWMLAVGALAVLVEAAVVVPRALRLRRRGMELARLLEGESGWFEAWSARTAAAAAETRHLLGPTRAAARVLRHPLAAPLLRYALRRVRAHA